MLVFKSREYFVYFVLTFYLSSGTSSVDLTKVALPVKKTSAVAMVTGVAGPIGRTLSQQMGIGIGRYYAVY